MSVTLWNLHIIVLLKYFKKEFYNRLSFISENARQNTIRKFNFKTSGDGNGLLKGYGQSNMTKGIPERGIARSIYDFA